MIINLVDLKEKTIRTPNFEHLEWDAIINDSTKYEKELLETQRRGVNLLSNINECPVVFSKLAWLNLWTKTFNILDGAFFSLNCNSSLSSLHLLKRAILEFEQHIFTIFEPLGNITEKCEKHSNIISINPKRKSKFEVIDRLKAYAAWCLWCDKGYLEYCLKPEVLNEVYNSEDALNLLSSFDSLEDKNSHEKLFGKLDGTPDDITLKKDRLKIQDYGRKVLNYINNLLKNDNDLNTWSKRIAELSTTKRGFRLVSYYELFNKDESSFYQKLEKSDLKFAYSEYKLGSMFMHSSSLARTFHISDNMVIPNIMDSKNSKENDALFIGSRCTSIYTLLSVLKHDLWN